MDMSKYERAMLLRKRIEHVNKSLLFLSNVQQHGLRIIMQETGFVSRPEKFICEEADTNVLIKAFESDRRELEKAFEAL